MRNKNKRRGQGNESVFDFNQKHDAMTNNEMIKYLLEFRKNALKQAPGAKEAIFDLTDENGRKQEVCFDLKECTLTFIDEQGNPIKQQINQV